MNQHRTDIVTPNTSADNARNRPAGLPRRQRLGSAIVSAVISGVLLGGVVVGMTQASDGPQVMAGQAGAPNAA
jgi:hypothetical protein